MITIAGSGPSTGLIERVDVATKKRSIDSDYVFCQFPFLYRRGDIPMMVYYDRGGCACGRCDECKAEKYYCNSKYWDEYYKQFSKKKPSTGLCAVFCVIERWKPKTIGLIGFDGVLDGYPGWTHDADAERRAILSLTNIKDLRNDHLICGV